MDDHVLQNFNVADHGALLDHCSSMFIIKVDHESLWSAVTYHADTGMLRYAAEAFFRRRGAVLAYSYYTKYDVHFNLQSHLHLLHLLNHLVGHGEQHEAVSNITTVQHLQTISQGYRQRYCAISISNFTIRMCVIHYAVVPPIKRRGNSSNFK